MAEKNYKIKLNSTEKLEEILQETYDQACKHFNEVQNAINSLSNSTNLAEEGVSIEEKTKFSKAMHDFLGDKRNAIALKMDIAKFMGEIIKHNGSIDSTLNDKNVQKATSINISKLRAELEGGNKGETDSYNLKR